MSLSISMSFHGRFIDNVAGKGWPVKLLLLSITRTHIGLTAYELIMAIGTEENNPLLLCHAHQVDEYVQTQGNYEAPHQRVG